jgi:hypothetical protein
LFYKESARTINMGFKMPSIKKRISAFLVGEDGKISKDSVMKAGAILGAIGITSALLAESAAAHTNRITSSYSSSLGRITGTHTSHGSHGSHGSHASHGSHCSGWWCD